MEVTIMPNVKVGTETSTGAAININLGFDPDYFCIENQNAAEGEVAKVEKYGGQTGEFQTFKNTVNSATSSGVTNFYYDSSGTYLSAYDTATVVSGTEVYVSGGIGITVAAAFSDNADVLFYHAISK
jgi:hypothetical protein